MMTLLAFLTAWACPPTADTVVRARSLFDDAEPAQAARVLAGARDELGCQETVVSRATLLELYRLQALVALSQGLDAEAADATRLAVTIDPLAAPPSAYGPQLADLHRAWAGRMSGARVRVSVLGGGEVWLDGEVLRHGQETWVLQGHHLIQIQGEGDLRSIPDLLDVDRSVVTGLPVPEPVQVQRPLDQQPTAPVTVVRRRWRPAVLWVAGGLVTATGVGLTTVAAAQERRFHRTDYDDWQRVDAHAYRIQALYVAGYSSLGAGGVTLGTGILGLPRRRR